MKEIKLNLQGKNKGKYVALVDDEDYEYLSQWRWYSYKGKYAQRMDVKSRHTVLMHRFIMDADKGLEVDHIDNNGMNNTRSNLRICTHLQNTRNKKTKKKYKGVYKDNFTTPGKNRFYAQIKVNGKLKHIATYKTEIEAAIAYNNAATKYFGEYAGLNKI